MILILVSMNFDAVVVFVTSQTLFFRLVLAILCDKYYACILDKEKGINLKFHKAKR